jgi:hypothetical protein
MWRIWNENMSGEVIDCTGSCGFVMRAFLKRFFMHYGIYRRYPLGRVPAIKNAWRISRA